MLLQIFFQKASPTAPFNVPLGIACETTQLENEKQLWQLFRAVLK